MSTNSVLEELLVDPELDQDDATAEPFVVQHDSSRGPRSRAGAPPRSPEQQTPVFSAADAAELAARRTAQAGPEARLRGWKPLTIWYAFSAIVIAIGAISSLASGGTETFFLGAAICAACVKYTHYLYNGGRRRVWFFIW